MKQKIKAAYAEIKEDKKEKCSMKKKVAEEEAPKEPEAEAATEATEENKDKPACTTHVCHNKVKKLI